MRGNRKRVWLFDHRDQVEEYKKWANKLGFSGVGSYVAMVARWGHYMFTKAFERAEKAITDELVDAYIEEMYRFVERLRSRKGKK